MVQIDYLMINDQGILKDLLLKKLNTENLDLYFTQLLRKSSRSPVEEAILKTDYTMWKLFKVMKRTPAWSKNWLTSMTNYLNDIGYPLELSTNLKDSKGKIFEQKSLSFAKFLTRIKHARKILNLNTYEHYEDKDYLHEKEVFECVEIKKDLDPDFGVQSTYYTDKDHCLITQATPYYLKYKQENTLAYFKVFRRETPDKTHLCEFYQLEYVKKYHGKEPVLALINDFITLYRVLGLTTDIHVRSTRNNYTWPSFEFFTSLSSEDPHNLIEIGNSGIMDPLVLKKNHSSYDLKANYLAGAIGLERLYNVITGKKHISEAKNDYYF